MHVHAALFALRDVADEPALRQVGEQLKRVAADVDGVLEVFAGPNESRYVSDHTHAVVVVMETADALDAYRAHPLHVEASAALREIIVGGVGLDIGSRGV